MCSRMKLSEATRALMKKKRWKAHDLAAEAGLARSTVFNILADHDVDLETARKLKSVGVKHPLVKAA